MGLMGISPRTPHPSWFQGHTWGGNFSEGDPQRVLLCHSTRWCPPPQWCERWFIIPMNAIDINPNVIVLINQLNANELGQHLAKSLFFLRCRSLFRGIKHAPQANVISRAFFWPFTNYFYDYDWLKLGLYMIIHSINRVSSLLLSDVSGLHHCVECRKLLHASHLFVTSSLNSWTAEARATALGGLGQSWVRGCGWSL